MLIRAARPDDAPALAEIYNREVLTSTATFDLRPRTIDEQLAWQDDRSGAHAVVVGERIEGDSATVIGFASLSPYRPRPAYSTSVETSIYVHHEHRQTGAGKALLGELITTAERHGFHALLARIVGGHEASIALHKSLGFEHVGDEREIGRKFGRWLDVVVMERLLPTPASDGGNTSPTPQ